MDESTIVKSGMLFAMEAELQKHFEEMSAFEIIIVLNNVFAPQARAERNEALNLSFSARMEEHNNVSKHVVKRVDYVQYQKTLEYEIPDELAIDRVLQSLPPSYKQFVINYKMHGMKKTLAEFLSMLASVEVGICKGDDYWKDNCPK